MPYAAAHGIELHELRRQWRDGRDETLYSQMTKAGSKAMKIPVRLQSGMPASRSCTADYKINVIAKWQKSHGATQANPALSGLGISLDEMHRGRGADGVRFRAVRLCGRCIVHDVSGGGAGGMMATGNECVACGRLVDRGDSIWLSDDRLMHETCYRLATEMLFSGRYDALNGEEIVVLIRARIQAKADGK
jgi:hypothetical protein